MVHGGIRALLFSFYLNSYITNKHREHRTTVCALSGIYLPKIRALMTATAKMTGRMVGIIMAGGIGAGTVVTTGTVVTAEAPPVTAVVPVV